MNDWPLWEVFLRPNNGVAHRHVGGLQAPDAEIALNNARDVYTRRSEGVSIWVVPSAALTASDPDDRDEMFEPMVDKIFRHPSFYDVPVEIDEHGPAKAEDLRPVEIEGQPEPQLAEAPARWTMSKREQRQDDLRQRAEAALATVVDPELPFLTIADLGVLREVRAAGDGIVVVITPTYTGCPAVEVIRFDILRALAEVGLHEARVETVLAPAWTTDWLSDAACEKLRAHGIAPPEQSTSNKRALLGEADGIVCPQCDSRETELLSTFGPTACKALHRCTSCLEPFEAFKCI